MSVGSAATATKRGIADAGLFLGRVVLGFIFMAHGYQKLFDSGIAGTTEAFTGMGIPNAEVLAPVFAFVEFIGGLFLILGLFTPIVGLALAVDMIILIALVHAVNGLWVANNGWELAGALGAGALILGLVGPGRLSLDHLLFVRPIVRRRQAKLERERQAEEKAAYEARQREEIAADAARHRDAGPTQAPSVFGTSDTATHTTSQATVPSAPTQSAPSQAEPIPGTSVEAQDGRRVENTWGTPETPRER